MSLPFRQERASLGNSYDQALRRFLNLEIRLHKNRELFVQYSEFIRDYIDQGHMSKIKANEMGIGKYYIPHHCVLKPESVSTKLRVVFDASAKAACGSSLNDNILVGPPLQTDIVNILLKFRLYNVTFTADIRQMYRQILVLPADRDYQRILWRFNIGDELSEYRLNTVTYGVGSSPYLAIRTLKQLVLDEGKHFPLAAKILDSSIYVDDVVSGAETVEEAVSIIQQLIQLLSKGCFELRKWSSSHPEALSGIPAQHHQFYNFDRENSNLKVLGLQWDPSSDCFSYRVDERERPATKRIVLSEMARIYDPLGFLSPLTLVAKCIMQATWSRGLSWDEALPPDLKRKWDQYKEELSMLSSFKLPRRIVRDNVTKFEWHVFCDASEAGYGTVVYLRQFTETGIHVRLVCGKSKVSPLKVISIPRLELCAAVLGSNLIEYLLENISRYSSI